jgi:hypothetical protein
MGLRHILLGLVFLGALAPRGWAQAIDLTEPVKPGDCFRLTLDMDLAGEMRVHRDGKEVPLKHSASAHHAFDQRVLHVNDKGLVDKTANVYQKARVENHVGDDQSLKVLRPNRSLFVSQRASDQTVTYSPAGTLFREELEVTGEHFDTLALVGLLPGKTVKVGDTWKLGNETIQALCGFEGLVNQSVTGKLEKVQNNEAVLRFSGNASGIELGAQVKRVIDATCRFDLQSHRIVGVEWEEQDDRDVGPASPAAKGQVVTRLTRQFLKETPASLSDPALVSVPGNLDIPPQMLNLEYIDAKGRFDLVYPRDWQISSQTDAHVVLRLMEKGDFIAQATISPWTPAAKGQHLSPEEFKESTQSSPGWEPSQELQAGEVPAENGCWIYRVSAQGKLEGKEAVQNFYLVAAPDGRQVVLLFTMTPKYVDRLGTRDLSMAGSVGFPKK